MNPIVSKIRIIFLIIAASVFNAHMLIPHDHHQAENDACQLPIPESGRHNHKNFPVHCHAFNDLAAEKAISYHTIKQVQGIDFQCCLSETEIADLKLSWTSISDIARLTLKTNFTDLSSLRAPPVLI